MRANLPSADYFLGKQIPDQAKYRIVELLGQGCNALVFKAHAEELRHDIACKIIPRANLSGVDSTPPAWMQEIQKANVLQNPAVVKYWHQGYWKDASAQIDCAVLCCECVRGVTLLKYIKANKRAIHVNFIEEFMRQMMDFFNEMKERGVRHGDLHAGNIIVEDRSALLSAPTSVFRITDFGVATATGGHLLDDYDQLAAVLKELLTNVNFQGATPREKFGFNVLNDHVLARHLTERDMSRDDIARRPRALYERLTRIDAEFARRQQATATVTMSSPFDYLSCEQIGESHSLLRALYSGLFLALSDIENRNNVILTGPRGCGKSTVFKSLSLKHRVLTDDDAPEKLKYVSMYYRCDDLYFAFPRYTVPARPEALDIPIHFLTCTLLSELLESTEMWARKRFADEFARKERSLSRSLWILLAGKTPQEPGGESFRALVAFLAEQRQRAANKQRFVNDPQQQFGQYYGPDVLPKCCALLAQELTFLSSMPIYFMIDDYSAPKITLDLQSNLNRLVMQRSEQCFFKISTESPVSYSRSDIDKKVYVERREFLLVNLGLRFLDAENKEKCGFVRDVFARRLQAVFGYPVTDLVTLVGETPAVSYNDVARQIRKNEKPEFCGEGTLCDLCSGDIHYLISLVGKMVNAVGGQAGLEKGGGIPRIPSAVQNKAIREEAGLFLNNLRLLERGDRLVAIVSAFGNVAHSFLRYRNSKNEEGAPPHQASRIEPYEEPQLSGEAKLLYDELLRYSVFIEDIRGKSRRGKVVPRLFLRRFLVPHFNLTFSKRDSIELEVSEFITLLVNPNEFERLKRLKQPVEDKPDQPTLFAEGANG